MKNDWPQTFQIWTRWTIMSGWHAEKVQYNSSLKRLMRWKSPCRSSGKSCPKNTSTRQWWTLPSSWLICSNSVHLYVCILISPWWAKSDRRTTATTFVFLQYHYLQGCEVLIFWWDSDSDSIGPFVWHNDYVFVSYHQFFLFSFLHFILCRMCVCHMFNKELTYLLTYLLTWGWLEINC